EGIGPTCIAPEIFRRQMEVLEQSGCMVVRLTDVAAWLRGERELPSRCVALTFDDGFEDFAGVAHAELARRGWSATVFLPTGKVGAVADWDHHCQGRRLMSWERIRELSERGIDFGGHGVQHVDLTALTPDLATQEITRSGQDIEQNLGRPARSFAA